MRHCRRCTALGLAATTPAAGDSVLLLPPRGRGDGDAVRGAVTAPDDRQLKTSITSRASQTGAPVVSATTGELLAISLGSRLTTQTAILDAVARAKQRTLPAAIDSLLPTWPDAPMPPSRYTDDVLKQVAASVEQYRTSKDDITVLAMTPQVIRYRDDKRVPNPLAINEAQTKDPIDTWRPWQAYVRERRGVVMIDASGQAASFPFVRGADRRSDVREIRLFRDDVIVPPIEAGRYDAATAPGSNRRPESSRIAVYSPYEFASSTARFRVDVVDGRRTSSVTLPPELLSAIRRDLRGVLN